MEPGAHTDEAVRSSLSFVLPAFNEADNIEEAVTRCASVGDSLGLTFEVIVVDDGSQDATREILGRLSHDDPRVRSLHHPRNRGYGAALKSGLFAARMDKVFFTDSDLQFDVRELANLLRWADHYDIVAGYRAPRRDPWQRRFNGWAWSRLVNTIFDMSVNDVDCAFKVFDRRIFERIPVYSIGAFVNTEILVRARSAGFTLVQVPVTHYPRVAGTQTGANPRVILKAFQELVLLRGELRALGNPEEAVSEPARRPERAAGLRPGAPPSARPTE
jgi:glycosyltransferase involved in cell wall biosynthesis